MKVIFVLICIFIYSIEKPKKIDFEGDETEVDVDYNELFEWGIKNKLILSSSIQISSREQINFISKNNIKPNETLLTIPYNIMFTVEKALKLIKSKQLKKQYEEYKNIEFDDDEIDDIVIGLRKEESFISYILYLTEHRPKKYKKTKFYENYKNFIESLKVKPKYMPLFYDTEALEKLYLTYTSTLYNKLKRDYEEEIMIFKGELFNKKNIEFEDFIPHRITVHGKSIEILGHKTMVPFLNLFETNYINYNSNYSIENDGSIKIFSLKEIKKGEEIILSSPKMSNPKRLLFEGRTYEELIDYFDEYLLPIFGVSLYINFKIEDPELEYKYFMNLTEEDFDEYPVAEYSEHLDILKNSDYNRTDKSGKGYPYEILINNIKSYKEYLNNFNLGTIYSYFEKIDDRVNIERIIKGEAKILNKAYEFALKKAAKYIDLKSRTPINYNISDL